MTATSKKEYVAKIRWRYGRAGKRYKTRILDEFCAVCTYERKWAIVLTDIDSGWTCQRAVWNKGAHGVVEQIREMESKLPFELLGFDCDNGSEFLNHHLLRYFAEAAAAGGLHSLAALPQER